MVVDDWVSPQGVVKCQYSSSSNVVILGHDVAKCARGRVVGGDWRGMEREGGGQRGRGGGQRGRERSTRKVLNLLLLYYYFTTVALLRCDVAKCCRVHMCGGSCLRQSARGTQFTRFTSTKIPKTRKFVAHEDK